MIQIARRRKQRRGLTLVELMVVVIVLGILATLAIPNVVTAVNRSRANGALNNVRELANAEALAIAQGGAIVPYDQIADPVLVGELQDNLSFDPTSDNMFTYKIAAATAPATGFVVTATALAASPFTGGVLTFKSEDGSFTVVGSTPLTELLPKGL